ncbi:AbrB/MazE/SpoVT family DNA-binding domain-containing protein [Candidatus Gottesmanbacteria bacterium]|nr:AbrB/MazE/SpoVT family DNA-binding domain-containing protein [Candidatus Gottesmanbacteria bacterium]
MNQVSTITTKGQIVIPISIRQKFNLIPSTKIMFDVIDNTIIARPVITVDKAFGSIKTTKVLTKNDQKDIIKRAVIKKFK